MANYKEKVSYRGAESVSTLNGDIKIEQNRARMVIFDSVTQRELNVVDRTGYLFADASDRRIKIGSAPDDGRVGIWASKPGIDVIEGLNS